MWFHVGVTTLNRLKFERLFYQNNSFSFECLDLKLWSFHLKYSIHSDVLKFGKSFSIKYQCEIYFLIGLHAEKERNQLHPKETCGHAHNMYVHNICCNEPNRSIPLNVLFFKLKLDTIERPACEKVQTTRAIKKQNEGQTVRQFTVLNWIVWDGNRQHRPFQRKFRIQCTSFILWDSRSNSYAGGYSHSLHGKRT